MIGWTDIIQLNDDLRSGWWANWFPSLLMGSLVNELFVDINEMIVGQRCQDVQAKSIKQSITLSSNNARSKSVIFTIFFQRLCICMVDEWYENFIAWSVRFYELLNDIWDDWYDEWRMKKWEDGNKISVPRTTWIFAGFCIINVNFLVQCTISRGFTSFQRWWSCTTCFFAGTCCLSTLMMSYKRLFRGLSSTLFEFISYEHVISRHNQTWEASYEVFAGPPNANCC